MQNDDAWLRLCGIKKIESEVSVLKEPAVNNELPSAKTKRSKAAKKTLITFTGPFHTFSINLGQRSKTAALFSIVFLALFFVFGLISIPYAISNLMELDTLSKNIKNYFQN